jgi:putative transposase
MRKPRRVWPGMPHHVCIRGNNRRVLFYNRFDYLKLIVLIERALVRSPCAIHALTLMTNHVHLVVTPTDQARLQRFVHYFSQQYSRYLNRRRDGRAKLFEERFHSKPILSERQLAVCSAYADLNPVRAGLSSDPLDYAWSMYGHAVGCSERSAIPARLWTPSSWYLGLGTSDKERAVRYAGWVADCRARDTEPDLRARVKIAS